MPLELNDITHPKALSQRAIRRVSLQRIYLRTAGTLLSSEKCGIT